MYQAYIKNGHDIKPVGWKFSYKNIESARKFANTTCQNLANQKQKMVKKSFVIVNKISRSHMELVEIIHCSCEPQPRKTRRNEGL